MPLEFPPVVLDPMDQIMSFGGVISNIFLVLWCVSLWRDSKEFKHRLLLVLMSCLVLFSSIVYIFLPRVVYVSGPEFIPMELVIGYLYALFRFGYVTNALVIILGIAFIAFGRDNNESYKTELIVIGVFLIVGFILLSLNNATHRFLVWSGLPDEPIYLANIYPLLSSVGSALSDIRIFLFIFIGLKAKQYPLLLSGLATLGTFTFVIMFELSVQILVIEMSSFVLFLISLIAIYFVDSRKKSNEGEVT